MKKDYPKIKVLFVGADVAVGGVWGYINSIALPDYQDMEFHMTAACDTFSPGAAGFQRITKHKFSIIYSLWSLPNRALQLRQLIKVNGFDLLHLHTARAGFLGCLAASNLPVAIVYTGHSWRFEQKKTPSAKAKFFFYEKYICSRSDFVTFLTQRDHDLGVEKGLVANKKAVTIRTRIDAFPFENIDPTQVSIARRNIGISEDSVVIGNIGIMDERKDPITFIKTAAKIKSVFPNVHYIWIGDGVLREKTMQLARDLGMGSNFVVTGLKQQSEVAVLLRLMDVFLFTSRIEGVPLSVLEAQAAERPLVIAGYPGVEEVVHHGKTGYVFTPGNEDEAAGYILRCLQNKEETQLMIQEMRREFKRAHSDSKKMAQEFGNIYRNATEEASQAGLTKAKR